MKKLISLVLILASINLVAAVKLVLLGEAKTVDLLTVKLSDSKDFELLERSQIDRILKEHKLSQYGLTQTQINKYFPHADIFAIVKAGRLLVFNAKNGFRLMNTNASNIEGYAELIRQSVRKLKSKNPIYLSIVSVRDVGVAQRYKSQIKLTVIALEQALMRYDNIQLLERSHLELVHHERELTNKLFPLKASARLVTLEFEPGSEAHIINLKVLIKNLNNKLIGRVEFNDVFKDIPDSIHKLSKQIIENLNAKQLDDISRKKEAMRYFKEYMRLTRSQGSGQRGEIEKFRNAKEYLFSALALNPNHTRIRYEELRYYSKMLRKMPLDKQLEEAEIQFERAKKFRHKFPKSKYVVFEVEMIFGVIMSNRYFKGWTKDHHKKYNKLCRELRPLAMEEMKEVYYPYDLSNGINSLKELRHLHDVVVRNWPCFYGNSTDWLNQRLKDYIVLYYEAEKYIKQNPQDKNKANYIIRECELTNIFFPNRPVDLQLLRHHLEQTKELCKFVKNSNLDSVKPKILLLDAMREALKDISKEHFIQTLDHYLENVYKINPELLNPKDNTKSQNIFVYAHNYNDLYGKFFKYHPIVADRLKVYLKKNNLFSEFNELEQLAITMKSEQKSHDVFKLVLTKVDSMKKFNLERLRNHYFVRALDYERIIEYVFRNDSKKLPVPLINENFFNKVNSDFIIDSMPYYELRKRWKYSKEYIPPFKLFGAQNNGDEVVLFFRDKTILIYNSNGQFSKIPPPSKTLKDCYGERLWKLPIALSNRYLAFTDSKNNLHVYNRKTRQWSFRNDFFHVPVRSLLIHKDKIYVLAGDEEWGCSNISNYMFSCDLDGTNKKIIFSSERSEKQNELDKLRGGLSGLTAIGDHKLMFLLTYTNHYTYVWEYDLKNDGFKKVFKAPGSGTDTDLLWKGRDKNIYLVTYGWSERLYRFRPDKYKPEWIFAQSGGKRKFDPKDSNPVLLHGISTLAPPWRLNNGILWCGGGHSGILVLNKIKENPPLLLLPTTRYVFELGGGKMLFLGDYRFFVVQKKQKGTAK